MDKFTLIVGYGSYFWGITIGYLIWKNKGEV